MNKQVLLLGGLLGLALVGSYMSWTSEDAAADREGVVLLDAAPEQLAGVLWTSENLDVEISRRSDALGDYLWVKTTERKEVEVPVEPVESTATVAPPPEPGVDPAAGEDTESGSEPSEPEVEVEIRTTITEFKAGPTGDELFASLAPMVAQRRLDVGADRYADFGLDSPEATLQVQREGKEPKAIQIGGSAYGTRDRYALDGETVVLLDQEMLRPLKFATTRLPDRELYGVETPDIVGVRIEGEGVQLQLQQLNADDARNAGWAYAGQDAAEPDESAGAWMAKALGLKAKNYVQADNAPVSTTPVLTLELAVEGGAPHKVEILQGTDLAGAEQWYARSSHTRELVVLHEAQASELVADLPALVP